MNHSGGWIQGVVKGDRAAWPTGLLWPPEWFTLGVKGPQATPKGLRHGFGVAAIQAGIPLNLLQRWLGHAQLTTTAICANAVGPEERNIAARMWT